MPRTSTSPTRVVHTATSAATNRSLHNKTATSNKQSGLASNQSRSGSSIDPATVREWSAEKQRQKRRKILIGLGMMFGLAGLILNVVSYSDANWWRVEFTGTSTTSWLTRDRTRGLFQECLLQADSNAVLPVLAQETVKHGACVENEFGQATTAVQRENAIFVRITRFRLSAIVVDGIGILINLVTALLGIGFQWRWFRSNCDTRGYRIARICIGCVYLLAAGCVIVCNVLFILTISEEKSTVDTYLLLIYSNWPATVQQQSRTNMFGLMHILSWVAAGLDLLAALFYLCTVCGKSTNASMWLQQQLFHHHLYHQHQNSSARDSTTPFRFHDIFDSSTRENSVKRKMSASAAIPASRTGGEMEEVATRGYRNPAFSNEEYALHAKEESNRKKVATPKPKSKSQSSGTSETEASRAEAGSTWMSGAGRLPRYAFKSDSDQFAEGLESTSGRANATTSSRANN